VILPALTVLIGLLILVPDTSDEGDPDGGALYAVGVAMIVGVVLLGTLAMTALTDVVLRMRQTLRHAAAVKPIGRSAGRAPVPEFSSSPLRRQVS